MKKFFINLWRKFVTEPIAKRREAKRFIAEKIKLEQERLDSIKQLKDNFERDFNVSSNHVKDIINHRSVFTTNDPSARREYLNEMLVLGRKHNNIISKYANKTPFMYDPIIVDIHNESLELKTKNLSFDEIKRNETSKSTNSLRKQEEKFGDVIKIKRGPVRSSFGDISLDISLDTARQISHDEETKMLKNLESDLKHFEFAQSFKIDGIDLPEGQDINDFPILKKILGKDK
jgi:hypothetical protein